MKTIIKSAVAIAAVCLLTGCETTGLSPRESSGVSYPNYILSLPVNPAATPQRPAMPIRLAVAEVGEDAPPDAMLNKLAGHGNLVASVTGLPLPSDGVPAYEFLRANSPKLDYASRVKTICGLARISGADYVFLFGGNVDSWQENNALSVLDITVIGGVFVPGARIHIEGKGAGVLIDTTNCEPVLFVNSEAKDSGSSPDYLTEGKTMNLRVKVRDVLINDLTDQLLNKLTDLSATAKTNNQ
jgi:hypothetical protein